MQQQKRETKQQGTRTWTWTWQETSFRFFKGPTLVSLASSGGRETRNTRSRSKLKGCKESRAEAMNEVVGTEMLRHGSKKLWLCSRHSIGCHEIVIDSIVYDAAVAQQLQLQGQFAGPVRTLRHRGCVEKRPDILLVSFGVIVSGLFCPPYHRHL